MKDFIQFAILGIGIGSGYGLLAEGIVLIYRGSGVLNFAQGAIAMFCAYVFYHLSSLPVGVAIALSLAFAAAVGAVIQYGVMRPLKETSPLVRMIAALGLLLVFQAAATIIWGNTTEVVAPFLPQKVWVIWGITVTFDRVILLALVVVVTALGTWLPRRTNFGRATLALAESERSVAALGWSPDALATVNWMVGSVMAGLAGILITPFIGSLDSTTLTLVVLAAVAAALVGGLNSLPWTLVGALAIGMAEAVIPQYWSAPSSGRVAPFVVIVLILIVRGRSLPVRGHLSDKLPSLGTGRTNPWAAAIAFVAVVCFLLFATTGYENFLDACILSGVGAIFMLSMVVAMGLAGQLTLAQYAIAGIAALIAGHLSASGWGFLQAGVVGVLGATAIGSIVAIPALRTRGVNLAIITLGLGLVTQETVFTSPSLTGGLTGITIGSTKIFGVELSPVTEPARYCVLVIIVFALSATGVANVRRRRAGRRLIAVRGNERAAAALGISLFESKVYAFVLASALASIAGILLTFTFTTVVFQIFTPLASIQVLLYAVIGGIGYISGSIQGSILFAGGLGNFVFLEVFGNSATNWFALVGGVLLVVNLRFAPDGIAELAGSQVRAQFAWTRRHLGPVLSRFDRLSKRAATESGSAPEDRTDLTEIEQSSALSDITRRRFGLEVKDLTVRFGGLVAVNNVSFRIEPGTVTGLIGPNGAGKTTVIDAITGFVSTSTGKISLGTRDITSWPVHKRARAGLSRSFQSLELFDELTVIDNIRTASDPRDRWAYLTNLLPVSDPPLTAAAAAAVKEFGLEGELDRQVKDLPQGRRRLVAAARAVAVEPAVLLLDEPGAGLGDELKPEFVRLVRRLAQEAGVAVLLVEHDMDFVMSVCDHIIVLDFGKKLAEGTPSEIQSNPLVIASYLGEPVKEVAEYTDAPGFTSA